MSSRWKYPMCAIGPPNDVSPNLRNARKTSAAEPCLIAITCQLATFGFIRLVLGKIIGADAARFGLQPLTTGARLTAAFIRPQELTMKTALLLAPLYLTAALLAPPCAAAADRSITRLDGTKISFTDIDAQVARMMQVGNVSGLGVAILNNRKVAFLKAYGYRDTVTRVPLTVDSIMTAASFTKSTLRTP
jgi:hypothetical protein